MKQSIIPDFLQRSLHSRASGIPVWLVGGLVRDSLLDRATRDVDFVVDGEARSLAQAVAAELEADYFTLDHDRDVGRVLYETEGHDERWTIDFTRMRGGDIEADLRLRDFTVNAVGIPINDPTAWIDPTGGISDLQQGILRLCSGTALEEDPLRMLRAVRLASQFDFKMDPLIVKSIRSDPGSLGLVSAERVRDEFFKILSLPRYGRALRVMDRLDLLKVLCPEVTSITRLPKPESWELNPWEHTLSVGDHLGLLFAVFDKNFDPEQEGDVLTAQISFRLGRFRNHLHQHLLSVLAGDRVKRSLLGFAALYHGVPHRELESLGGRGQEDHPLPRQGIAQQRAHSLRLSRREIQQIGLIIRHQHRPGAMEEEGQPSRLSIYRYFRDTGPAGIDIGLLSLADVLGRYHSPVPIERWKVRVETVRTLFEAYFEGDPSLINPDPLLTGEEVLKFSDRQPGPWVGETLEALREAQVMGRVKDRRSAKSIVRKLLSSD